MLDAKEFDFSFRAGFQSYESQYRFLSWFLQESFQQLTKVLKKNLLLMNDDVLRNASVLYLEWGSTCVNVHAGVTPPLLSTRLILLS